MKSDKQETANQITMPASDRSLDHSLTLDNLLSTSILEEIAPSARGLGVGCLGVLYPHGTLYYVSEPQYQQVLSLLAEKLNRFEGHDGISLQLNDWGIRVLPLIHDFDTIGYLVLGATPCTSESKIAMAHTGELVNRMLVNHIRYAYKMHLTSRIHTQVVEDTYEELQKQNELLKTSESRYRNLAESLDAEVKRKTEEIQDANTQLMHQDKMASIGQLAAGVAHEINNPIGFIKSNLSTMSEYCRDLVNLIQLYRKCISHLGAILTSSDARETISNIIEEIGTMEESIDPDYLVEDTMALIDESMEGTERVRKIVSDLKDFAHPGKDTPSHADIHECLDSTLNIIWNELKYKVTVNKAYGQLPLLFCYPRQLNQVFMNIFVNAAHAIEKKGEITITTRADEEYAEIAIHDTGGGIEDAHLSKIFDPFFTTKEVGKGTGLGLNLSYNIVKKHHGDIQVKSRVGQGTTFTIKLPCKKKPLP